MRPRPTAPTTLLGGACLLAATQAPCDPPVLVPRFLPPRVGAVALGLHTPRPSKKAPAEVTVPRRLPHACTLHNLHTEEALLLDETPGPDEAALVQRLLRDRTTWEEHAIAAGPMATLRAAAQAFGAARVELVSGYRSDKLNEMLRKKGRHVARHSQHVLGNAVDFRLVGVDTQALLRWVRLRHVGGVGFYPHSGFVHVDAGPPRRWSGS